MAVIGIDLGTTFSVMAYIKDGISTVIPNAEGKLLTPSVVGFDSENHVYVGDIAVDRAILDSKGTIISVKRKMGTDAIYHIHGYEYTPVMVSSFILAKLKQDAQSFLGEEVNEAVITVPAYFSDIARQATKNAAEIAGLKVLRLINEPTAATLAYGLNQKESGLVMVLDLGGGTFDVSILEFADGVYEVKSTCGNVQLGGDDWTNTIYEYLLEKFQEKWDASYVDDPDLRHRIIVLAESAKKELTLQQSVTIEFPAILNKDEYWQSEKVTIDRSQFETLTHHLCDQIIKPIQHALKDGGIQFKDLDKVILVGGATRMPMIRRVVTEVTGIQPFIDIDPDKVIGMGAAVQAGVLTGSLEKVILVDVIPLSLGVEAQGGIFARLIKRNSKVPISKDRIFTTAFDNQTEVDIHILQGERELAKYNISLGKFIFSGLPALAKGMTKINITFSVDVNGILTVFAKDIYSETEEKMVVQSDKQVAIDIEKMIQQAEKYKKSDEETIKKIMVQIELNYLIEVAKKTLEKINIPNGSNDRLKIEALLQEANSLKLENKTEEISLMSNKIKELMDVIYKKWQRKKG